MDVLQHRRVNSRPSQRFLYRVFFEVAEKLQDEQAHWIISDHEPEEPAYDLAIGINLDTMRGVAICREPKVSALGKTANSGKNREG